MFDSPATGATRRRLVTAIVALALLVPAMLNQDSPRSKTQSAFLRDTLTAVKVEYHKDTPATMKDVFDALARGEPVKLHVSESERHRRKELATKRWGSPETARGRFYITLGALSEIETHNPDPGSRRDLENPSDHPKASGW